jgi:DNA replication protein DnaC
MERLNMNDFAGRGRRQPQGGAQHQQQQPPARPLPEQPVRQQQQRGTYRHVPGSSYGSNRPLRNPEDKNRAQEHGAGPQMDPRATRPFYPRPQRPQLNSAPTSYPNRQRQMQDGSYEQLPYPSVPPTRPLPDYDAYPPAMPAADVVDEWEEEGGMIYGEWESDSNEVLIYQRPRPSRATNVIPEEPYYSQEAQEQMSRQFPHPRHTRDLRLPAPVTQAQPAPVQQRYPQRMTQPLDPRVAARMKQAAPEVHKIRQIVPQEQPLVVAQEQRLPALPKGVCVKCKGAGYLRANVPFGHPNFGKPIACECKEAERKERRRQQLRSMSNLDAFLDQHFKNFNPNEPGVKEAYEVSHEYAQNPEGWLLLIGPNGCGKTHLAAAIANQSLDSGSVVLFSVVPDLLDHLRAAFAPNAKEVYDQLFSKMREAEVLILDDLGAQQSSPWATEKLFQLLNYRYNMGMPTVITANPRGLQGIDERIHSRLMDTALVYMVVMDRAHDYRRKRTR